ncbi:hypothetical protein [Tenacibaculum ovolyticum]|uniref:hypothetical protein n=1 Tax=Tenacibaculum ovolyticum TaxID=104270 RepID=UPI0007ECFB83|nr:hypothetical protein [Tenacibaculum ovolyticum]
MSKYIDEIIADILSNPKSYKDYKSCGITKGNIIIKGFGNPKILSVIDVNINGKDMPTTYFDRYKLEYAISIWYENIDLETLKKV